MQAGYGQFMTKVSVPPTGLPKAPKACGPLSWVPLEVCLAVYSKKLAGGVPGHVGSGA